MGHDSHKEYPGQAWGFLIITVGVLVLLVYGFGSSIQDSAKELFDLSPSDLFMIPIGGAAFVLFWRLTDKVLFAPVIEVIEKRI